MPIFSQAEMGRRTTNLRQRMAEQGLDAVIATSYAAAYYLSGAPIHAFGRPMATIVTLDDEPALIESIIEAEHTRHQSWLRDVRHYWDYNPTPVYEHPRPPPASLIHHLRTVLAERGLLAGRLGIEEAHLPLGQAEALRAALPQADFVGVSGLLDRLRLVLSDEELRLVRAADAIAEIGQQTLLELLAPGRTAEELTLAVQAAMRAAILTRHPEMPFHFHAGCGLGETAKRSGHSEWVTWNRASRVEAGQLLETGMSVWLWGYWGNVERAIAVGEPRPAVRRPFEVMVAANEAAIAAIRPGAPLAEIDRITKAVFAEAGYGTVSGSGCGRGIVSYEGNARELAMDLRLYSDVVLEPGMAFSLEPDLQVAGIGTFRHCNTIIVTVDGCEVDSQLPRGVLWV